MKTLYLSISFWLLLSITSVHNVYSKIPIVPYPNEVIIKEGEIDVSEGMYVSGTSEYRQYLENILDKDFGLLSKAGIPIKLIVGINKEKGPRSEERRVGKEGRCREA